MLNKDVPKMIKWVFEKHGGGPLTVPKVKKLLESKFQMNVSYYIVKKNLEDICDNGDGWKEETSNF